jgi:dTDP-4-dehydrorhamnose reductase
MTHSLGRILVTGASGQLGSYVLRELRTRDVPAVAWSMRPNVELFGYRCQSVDLREVDQVVAAFRAAKPDVVLHVAAMSGVGDCFRAPMQARQTNATATRLLAELADRHPARMVYVSTDLVFPGDKSWYCETDCPAPLSVYGQTKATAERAVLDHRRHLVLRISLLFGPSINGRTSFFDQQLLAIQSGSPCSLFEDEWRTPVSLQIAARGLLAAGAAQLEGILHLGGPERMSRWDMGYRLARVLGKDPGVLRKASREDAPAAEPRPRDTSLNSAQWDQRFPEIPRWDYEESLRQLGVTGSPS